MNAHMDLQLKVDQYLAERHLLGFELKSMGLALPRFAEYIADSLHKGPLTIQVMAEWAQEGEKSDSQPSRAARRLKLLRPFCRWLRQFEPLTDVPDEMVFGPIQERVAPHIYHDSEIVELLAAAGTLNPQKGLRPRVYATLFGLIASTGLRISEALALLDKDVDIGAATLTVRETKFAKTRLLPLHSTVASELKRYRDFRHCYWKSSPNSPFFINTRGKLLGTCLGDRQVHRVFVELRDGLQWPDRGAHGGPRIHDLSYPNLHNIHTFFLSN